MNTDLDYSDIGRRIKFYRNKAKLKQSDLAEKLDVSISYISQIERGKSDVSLDRLNQIATMIKCKLQYLIADADTSEPDYLNNEIIQKIANWGPGQKRLLIKFIDMIQDIEIKE